MRREPSRHMQTDYTLLSVDVWDTLLRRPCHPDEVKLFSSRYIYLSYHKRLKPEFHDPLLILGKRREIEETIARHNRARGLDGEYAIEDVMEKLASAVLTVRNAEEAKKIRADVIEAEIRHECSIAYADDTISALLTGYSATQSIFLSDFYMSPDQVRRILAHAGADTRVMTGHTSSGHLLSKSSGRLFRAVHEAYSLLPREHLHIGDHAVSDRSVPARLGISAKRYVNRAESRLRLRRERLGRARLSGSGIDPLVRELSARLRSIRPPQGLTGTQKKLLSLGARHSLIFYAFVLFVIEEAIKNGIGRIYYFSREGYFFSRIHEEIRKRNPLGMPIPDCEVLQVSRKSTFAASLFDCSVKEMRRLWNLHTKQSMEDLFMSLDIDISGYASMIQSHCIDAREKIKNPGDDERIRNLFRDWAFIKKLKRETAGKRKMLLAYLSAHGIRDDRSPLFIVDIGWRGSVQDNLAAILPGKTIRGCYLGLHGFLNEQPRTAIKKSYGPDGNRDPLEALFPIHFESVLETLSNTDRGSARGYARRGKSITAIEETFEGEARVWRDSVRFFQEGALAAAGIFTEYVRDHALSSRELRPAFDRALTRLIVNPPIVLARAFRALHHNETFGLGRIENMKEAISFPFALLLKSFFKKTSRGAAVEALRRTRWPHAALKLRSRLMHLLLKGVLRNVLLGRKWYGLFSKEDE